MPKRSNKDQPTLTTKQYIYAMWRVGVTTYKAAPLAIVVQLIGAMMSAILPLVTTYFAALTTTTLAEAYGGQDVGDQAILYVLVTAGLGVAMTGWRSLENYLSQEMRYRIESTMTDRMYEHFLHLDFWRYDDKDTVDMYEKARKFAQFFPYIFERMSSLVTAIVSMFAGIIALVFVSRWLALISLFAIVPGIYIQMKLSRMQTEHWNENIEARRVVNWIEWGIMQPDKIAELRLYGVVRHLLDLRQMMRDKDEKAQIGFERSFIWKRLGADVFEAAAEIIALIWITLQIIAKQQAIGQFIYVQQVVSRAIGGANNLVSGISSIDQDIANLFDYQRFMELPEDGARGENLRTPPNEIVIENISFRYPQAESNVLSDVSFRIKKGEHIAIVGENGAGKSTLVKILAGLYKPTAGRVLLDATPLASVKLADWHGLLGVLSQDFIKYDFADARHNITFGDTKRPYDEHRLKCAIETSESEFLYKLPQQLDTYVDQWMEDDEGHKGQDLSGGQWQRLALARNFYRDAPIVILDEPTSAIDALAESRIFRHLFSLREKTIITISHRLTNVKKADVVYTIKDGTIVEHGTAKELIEKEGEFYRMFESQIK